MSKKKTTKPEAENPEVEQPVVGESANTQPDYVNELLEKGVTVLQGRSRGELDEMLANIPSDCNFEVGLVSFYLDKGLYRLQVNLKQ